MYYNEISPQKLGILDFENEFISGETNEFFVKSILYASGLRKL